MTAAALLAHQGGWDEILLVAGPIAIIGGLLWLAKKRVEGSTEGQGAAPRDGAGEGDPLSRG